MIRRCSCTAHLIDADYVRYEYELNPLCSIHGKQPEAMMTTYNEPCESCAKLREENIKFKKAVDYAAKRLAEIERAVFGGDTVLSDKLRERLKRPIRDQVAWRKRIMNEVEGE
jgi:hypothetical protein